MNENAFRAVKNYVESGVSATLALRTRPQSDGELTSEQVCELELASARAEADLIKGLFDTGTGARRGDPKTALMLLERINPVSWSEAVLEAAKGPSEGIGEDVVIKALQKKGYKVTK